MSKSLFDVESSGTEQSLACRRQAILLQATVGLFRDGRSDGAALDEAPHHLVQLSGRPVAAERACKLGLAERAGEQCCQDL
ncbi:MAG: hypothetical protein KA763_11280 [Xanthomonadales bacterium]|nr:hypothetical protein [Xanthomonadales bacterium]